MLLPGPAWAGQDFLVPPVNVRDPSPPSFGHVAGRDPRRCRRGHRMAVPAAGRCLYSCWQAGGVPAPGLPVVRRAAGVLVWLPASCAGGGPLPEDLRAAAAVRAVPGEPCAAAGVRAG